MPTHWMILARASAALLFAAGPTAVATPAPAAGSADLSVRISGTTLNNAATTKVATTTVTNHGPAMARGVRIWITGWVDSEVVDAGTVTFCPRPSTATSPLPATLEPPRVVAIGGECALPDMPPGRSLKLDATIDRWANATGQVGEIQVSVSHAGTDPVPTNDSAKASLTVAQGAGPDLYSRAWDVPTDDRGRVGAAAPGRTADLRFEIGNQGTASVSGIKLRIRLPQYVTFANGQRGCVYGADRHSATCTYLDLPIIAAKDDTDPGDENYSAVRFRQTLKVDGNAPAPSHLPGGVVSVEPIAADNTAGMTAKTRATLPEGVTGAVATDLDASDNSDGFTVFTARPGRTDGGAGGLPVTGVPAGLVGGVGLGAVLIGGALLLMARRRRIVAATPDDEQPAT